MMALAPNKRFLNSVDRLLLRFYESKFLGQFDLQKQITISKAKGIHSTKTINGGGGEDAGRHGFDRGGIGGECESKKASRVLGGCWDGVS